MWFICIKLELCLLATWVTRVESMTAITALRWWRDMKALFRISSAVGQVFQGRFMHSFECLFAGFWSILQDLLSKAEPTATIEHLKLLVRLVGWSRAQVLEDCCRTIGVSGCHDAQELLH